MVNKDKIVKFVNLAMILIFVCGLITIIEHQYNENYVLKNRLIVNEAVILNTVRSYEYHNNLTNIELMRCRGFNNDELDSMKLMLTEINRMVRYRDSLFIVDRFKKLEEYHGF